MAWAQKDGGFDPLRWLPGGLFVLFLLLLYALVARGRLVAGRAPKVALAALTGYTAWSYLTIAWAGVKSDAWDGANLTFVYLCVYALFALRPMRPVAATVLMGVYALAVAGVGVVEFVHATTSADPLRSFIAGRIATPIAYPNANCALFISAAWPAFYLSSRRQTPALLRGVFLAAVGVLAELALMAQSRGSLVAVPIALVLYFVLVNGRLRSALWLGPVVVAVALSTRPVLEVYQGVVSGTAMRHTLLDARSAMLWTAVALAVVGVGLGLADRVVTVPRRLAIAFGATLVAVALSAGAFGSAELVERYGNPIHRASDWWTRFKGGSYLYEAGTPHLVSGLGSGRYDIWRVAADTFREHPVAGIGVNNFAVDYLRERTKLEDPLYPHSVELRTLVQTGLVGSALLLTFVAAALATCALARSSRSPVARSAVGASLVVFGYWAIHGSIDWFWEIPALAAPAFAFLGVATAIDDRAAPSPDGHEPILRRPLAVGLATLALVPAASLVLPLLSAAEVDAAVRGWRADAPRAFSRLDAARSLDPLSDGPDVYAAVIAAQIGDQKRQRAALERAARRNPSNWYPLLELGALDAREGRRAAALDWLARAKELNPLEPTIDFVRNRALRGRPAREAEIENLLVRRVDLLTGKRQGGQG